LRLVAGGAKALLATVVLAFSRLHGKS